MRFRSLKTLTPPTVEPVTLAEAKAHCRVDTSTDDAYLSSLITAAREWCEAYCDETFVHTQYRMTLDSFPREIELPRPPMASSGTVTAVTITYTMESQQTATLSASQYRVDRDATPGVIRNVYNGSWPSHLLDQNSVSVAWWAGYGDASTVPQRVKTAILMCVHEIYEKRGGGEMPDAAKRLLDSVSWGSYT